MLRNYLIAATRSLLKFRAFTAINLSGLALGLMTGIFILLYVFDELSFDRFHEKANRIYRVGTDIADIKTNNITGSLETNGWPVGALIKKDYPEVEALVYTRSSGLVIHHDGKRFEERLFYASKDFFYIFTFPLTQGNEATALEQPNTIVISESLEKKFFGTEKALGKMMLLGDSISMLVTGVMEDVPAQSHMQFDALISFPTYLKLNKDFTYDGGWGNINVRNYLLLSEQADPEAFVAKARNIYMDYVKDDMKNYGKFMYAGFEPLSEIYLKTKRGNGMGPSGSATRVYLVAGIAAFVLLLACINFINLATARAGYRAKEVGLRKVVGSSRKALIFQFLSESLLVTTLSLFLALVLTGLLMPLFNQLIGKTYHLTALAQPSIIAGLLALVAAVAFLSGYYPALVMTSVRPAEVLKGKLSSGPRGVQLRRSLVIFQFMISATLIICTWVVRDQLEFMKNSDLGFSGDQLLVVPVDKIPSSERLTPESFKNELSKLPGVAKITFTNAIPGKPGWVGQWAKAAEKSSDETVSVEYMSVDEDFIQTLELDLIAGHNFDLASPAEIKDGLIINEKTVQVMGWNDPENAIGKKIESPSSHPAGTVIGVVKDYHEFGLQKEIYPMTMDYAPEYSRFYVIKFSGNTTTTFLEALSTMWKQHYDGRELEYFFLDENFQKQYQSEQKLAKVFLVFSTMTVVIAVIGLIGLVSFMVVAKTKEIGVRKLLGADVFSIVTMLSREFIIYVLVANLIACPLSWYLSNLWLEGFAFRTSPQPIAFAFTILSGIVITAVAISFQTIKAALGNPAEALRRE